MKWLARLEVDEETVQSEKIWDSYAWHQRLWEDCFSREPDAKREFLTRIDPLEGTVRIWILANRKPIRPQWCPSEGFTIKEIAPSFLSHKYYAFDLRANPVKAVVQRGPNGETLYKANGKRKSGKRQPLIKPTELQAWLSKRAENGGFRVIEDKSLEISPMVKNHFRKKDNKTDKEHAAYHGGVQFRGVLEVTDRDAFIKAYQSGIGSAKGFGFGMLLLAPVNQ